MEKISSISSGACRIEDISAYIDGELTAEENAALESHFSVCSACNSELNRQKGFLNFLGSSLMDDGTAPPPEEFARVVTLRAESTVGGLRAAREWTYALGICFVIILLAGAATVFGGSDLTVTGRLIEGVLAVISAAGHLIFAFGLGIAVDLRALTFDVSASPALWFGAIVFLVAVYAGFRTIGRVNRSRNA
jgi:anti-sigma factor RsiW